MSEFRDFSLVRTNTLFIKRVGWFHPYFELTDGQFIYGKLNHSGTFKRDVRIETADGFWTLKRGGWFTRVMNLNKNEDEQIGTVTPAIWKNKISLKMENGFEATLVRKDIFIASHVWNTERYGELLSMKLKPFCFKTPYIVTVNPGLTKKTSTAIPSLPLLALLGLSIIIHRQRHATAYGA